MAMTPAFQLAYMFLPNFVKLKGAATVMSALERKDKIFLDPLWQQAYVTHNPHITPADRDPYRVAVLSLPKPKEMGEAHMAGLVLKKTDPAFMRLFFLEHDYVLAQKRDRTVLTERDGKETKKHGEGPALAGDADADAKAFIDAFMELIVPTKVTRR